MGELYFDSLSLFQNLSLLFRTQLNRKQKYHSEILLFFEGAEVSQEGKKKKDYGSGIDAEIKALAKESPPQQGRPNRCF